MTVYALEANFTHGEVNPLLHARSDAQFFQASLAEARNWMVLKYGGIRRRSGFRYRGTVKTAADTVVLIPFVFSSTVAYVLEFGDLYVRFWNPDGTRVTSGGSPYEIVSPYSKTDIANLKWAQSNDIMYMAHKSYAPRKLIRSGNTSWAFSFINFLDGPYQTLNDSTTTLTPSATPTTGASITITASAIVGINNGTGFQATDVNRLIRFQFGGHYSWGAITAVSSTTVVTVLVKEGHSGGTTATLTWRLGAFSDTTGYPGAVSFFQGRLAWARTNSNPRMVAMSASNLPETYKPSDEDGTVTDDEGVTYDIIAGDEILWLAESASLQIGTLSAIRSLGSADTTNLSITPRNVAQKIEVTSGTNSVPPVKAGPSTIHAGRFGRSIHDLYFQVDNGQLTAPDISKISDHFFKTGISRLAYTADPDSVIWALTASGLLIGCTFDRDEKILGFHAHTTANGTIEAICSVPDPTNGRDVLFAQIKRTINNATVRYIETMDAQFDTALVTQSDAFFVDAGLSYSGVAAGTVSGLSHLEGQTVDILADGAVFPQQVVASGAITLPGGRTATKINVGIPISAYAITLRAANTNNEGSNVGLEKRVVRIVVDEFETLGLKVGPVGAEIETLAFRDPSTPMGQAPALNTGTVRVPVESGWKADGSVKLICDQPLPATVRALNIGIEP